LLICPNLHAGFGVCDFGQQISANLQGKFAAANYESLIPATLDDDDVANSTKHVSTKKAFAKHIQTTKQVGWSAEPRHSTESQIINRDPR